MEYGKVIKRSFVTTWNYRSLWTLTTIVALLGGRGCSHGSFSVQTPFSFNPPVIPVPLSVISSIVIIALVVWGIIARYISEVALIKLVDHNNATKEMLSFKEGYVQGKTVAAFRLFQLDLLILLLISILFIVPSIALVYPNYSSVGELPLMQQLMGSLGLMALILIAILSMLLLLPPIFLVHPVIVLEERSLFDAIARTKKIISTHSQSFFMSILIQIGIGAPLGMLGSIAIVISVLFGSVIIKITSLLISLIFSSGGFHTLANSLNFVTGAIELLVVILLPIAFVRGFVELFYSSYWTLYYRELFPQKPAELSS